MTEPAPFVVVFGSLHYDIIVDSPARPRKGETIAGHSWQPKCGGKGGNQAVAAAGAGARSAMIGAVAQDDFGRTLLGNLAARGVDPRFVRISPGTSTGMSVAICDSDGDYGAVIVSGANLSLSEHDVLTACELFARGNILVLQNEVPDTANAAAAAAMKAAGGLVILNAAPARVPSEGLASCVDILVVNAIEAELLAGVPVVESLKGAQAAARILAGSYPTAVVTVGDKGVASATVQGEAIAIEAIPVELVSTHGAGDEFIGVLAACLLRGDHLAEALARANRAAADLVSRPAA
ncbi:PfkB family carbohydrate kinase [Kaistia granuli]|uniref:PfkB family carbohydrate kinase n=1 Tax=Kaistia granuli TaxID=363259 RepID=UPI00036FD96B|nr:PfkB family carbohydrate kinase [Kaistia granuli]